MAGISSDCIIDNCGVIATDGTHSISGTYAGGLIGEDNGSYVISCFSNIPVNTQSTIGYVGGLIGFINEYVSNSNLVVASYSLGQVTSSNSNTKDYASTGGLVGKNKKSMILSCYSTGGVTASAGNIGGLVGTDASSVYYCATSSQKGTASLGGTNGETYTGIGTNSGTATGCFGNITTFADIRSKIVTDEAEAQWTTYKAAHTNLPEEISSKKLSELWGTASETGLKLSWEK